MTPDEHQRERRDFWKAACVAAVNSDLEPAGERADYALESFDKRFPAPSAAAPVEPVHWSMGYEIDSLRQKARLWDAVASGKVRIDYNLQDTYGAFYGPIGKGKRTDNMDTAEEAVESAIAQGALK